MAATTTPVASTKVTIDQLTDLSNKANEAKAAVKLATQMLGRAERAVVKRTAESEEATKAFEAAKAAFGK